LNPRTILSEPTREAVMHAVIAGAIVALAAALRWEALAPSSLWLDDAWVALVTRARAPEEIYLIGITAPGFTVLLWGWLELSGFSELKAQLLPFLAGIACPAVIYLTAVHRGLHKMTAITAAGLLVASPVHMIYSTRVKQYTIDALLVTILLAVAWGILEGEHTTRRWVAFAWLAVMATVVSAATLPVIAALMSVCLGICLVRRCAARKVAAMMVGSYGLFGVLWLELALRPALTPQIRQYWSFAFVTTDGDIGHVFLQLLNRLSALLVGFVALPWGLAAVGLLASLFWAAARRPLLGALLASSFVLAVLLALLQLVPLGGRRSDIYLYPILAVAMALGLEPLTRMAFAPAIVATAVCLIIASRLPFPVVYPREDLRPLVHQLELAVAPADVVLVYPGARWAFALYTGQPVEILDRGIAGWPFNVKIDEQRIRILNPHRADPRGFAPEIRSATLGRHRAWLIASHWRRVDLSAISESLQDLGFEAISDDRRRGALLMLWERT
jgi:hypothetical protein